MLASSKKWLIILLIDVEIFCKITTENISLGQICFDDNTGGNQ